MIDAAVIAFHNTDWFNLETSHDEAAINLNNVLNSIEDETTRAKFVANQELFQAYYSFLEFKANCDQELSLEKIYQKFVTEFSSSVDKIFFDLFQFININSYSEAYCESVGSLMNIVVHRGRNMAPVYFSKELIIAFSSPPIHVLNEKIIPNIVNNLSDLRFFRKLEITRFSAKVKYLDKSSSVGNYRQKEEEESHLPLDIFK